MQLPMPVSTPETTGVLEPDAVVQLVPNPAPAGLAGSAASVGMPPDSSGASPAGAANLADQPPIIIADRGEFIDALRRLRRGHVLVRPRAAGDDDRANCVLDSGVVYTAFQPMLRYGLIDEYVNPQGFATMRYFRLTSTGKRFADKALRVWRKRPLLERMAVRLFG